MSDDFMRASRWEVVDDGWRPDKDKLIVELVNCVLKRGEEACDDLMMTREELTRGLKKLSIAALYCINDALGKQEEEIRALGGELE